MNARFIALAAVAMVLGSFATAAHAQDEGYAAGTQDRAVRVGPDLNDVPRLGFDGRMINGRLKVEGVAYGSLAEEAGLERGDVIAEVNGRTIRSMGDYQQALLDAQDGNGRVRLLIENVRWHTGESSQRWVNRTVYLFRSGGGNGGGGEIFGG